MLILINNVNIINNEKIMIEWKIRLKEIRKEKNLTMEQLSNMVGNTKSAVSLWENQDKKNEPNAENLTKLCEVLGINAKWLLHGTGEKYNNSNANLIRVNNDNDNIDLFDDGVLLPLLKEKLSNKNGTLIEVDNMGKQHKISKSILKEANIDIKDAVVAIVNGNSMLPVLPNGTLVVINTKMTKIIDGEIYAIDHNGMLRIVRLYKTALGIRIKLYNDIDYSDEEYKTQDDLDKIKVIGFVFYYSVIRNLQ